MKYLMLVGDQLDLAVSYDGGAVDAVQYLAPDGFANKVSVNASGVVTALGLGEGLVHVFSDGVKVGNISFEVVSPAAYAAQQGIRNGSKAFAVGAAAVPQGPPPSVQISLNTMTAASQGGYTAFGALHPWARAYDAFNGTFVLGEQNGSSAHAAGSNNDTTPITTIGQILPEAKALRSFTLTVNHFSIFPQFTIEASVDTTTGHNGTWATIFTSDQYPFEGPGPEMILAEGVVLTWLDPHGNNRVLTKTFNVANNTGFRAYRLKIEGHPGRQFTFRELLFYGY
jgi:hypothetical protein